MVFGPEIIWPTKIEVGISFGIWAIGLLVVTVLYKIAASVKETSEIK